MKLTAHFDTSEFLVSKEFPDLARQMILTDAELESVYLLCATILEPVREHFGPLTILSGKRSPELNAALDGVAGLQPSPTSQHMQAQAADILPAMAQLNPKMLNDVHQYILTSLPYAYGQAIIYYKDDLTPRFIHVSIPAFSRDFTGRRAIWQYKGEYRTVRPW